MSEKERELKARASADETFAEMSDDEVRIYTAAFPFIGAGLSLNETFRLMCEQGLLDVEVLRSAVHGQTKTSKYVLFVSFVRKHASKMIFEMNRGKKRD